MSAPKAANVAAFAREIERREGVSPAAAFERAVREKRFACGSASARRMAARSYAAMRAREAAEVAEVWDTIAAAYGAAAAFEDAGEADKAATIRAQADALREAAKGGR